MRAIGPSLGAPSSPIDAAAPTASTAALGAARGAEGLTAASRVDPRGARGGRSGGRERRSLATRLFGASLGPLGAGRALRPAAIRAELETLHAEIERLHADAPEDLFEIALGALEDEIANVERLQAALQAAARR